MNFYLESRFHFSAFHSRSAMVVERDGEKTYIIIYYGYINLIIGVNLKNNQSVYFVIKFFENFFIIIKFNSSLRIIRILCVEL